MGVDYSTGKISAAMLLSAEAEAVCDMCCRHHRSPWDPQLQPLQSITSRSLHLNPRLKARHCLFPAPIADIDAASELWKDLVNLFNDDHKHPQEFPRPGSPLDMPASSDWNTVGTGFLSGRNGRGQCVENIPLLFEEIPAYLQNINDTHGEVMVIGGLWSVNTISHLLTCYGKKGVPYQWKRA